MAGADQYVLGCVGTLQELMMDASNSSLIVEICCAEGRPGFPLGCVGSTHILCMIAEARVKLESHLRRY